MMIIHFSSAELENLKIEYHPRREPCADYISEREQVWLERLAKVEARGGQMWNGEVYTMEDIAHLGNEQVILCMSSCEFKDAVFRRIKGSAAIAQRFGLDHVVRATTVTTVPLTLDGKYVVGLRGDQDRDRPEPIATIGGMLSKDEMEVHDFNGIRAFMDKEIREETHIDCPLECLKFAALFCQNHTYTFLFALRLPISSAEVNRLLKPGEFSQMLALSTQEIASFPNPQTPALKSISPYLEQFFTNPV